MLFVLYVVLLHFIKNKEQLLVLKQTVPQTAGAIPVRPTAISQFFLSPWAFSHFLWGARGPEAPNGVACGALHPVKPWASKRWREMDFAMHGMRRKNFTEILERVRKPERPEKRLLQHPERLNVLSTQTKKNKSSEPTGAQRKLGKLRQPN